MRTEGRGVRRARAGCVHGLRAVACERLIGGLMMNGAGMEIGDVR